MPGSVLAHTNQNTSVVLFATLIRVFLAMNLWREAEVAFAALIYRVVDSAGEILPLKHSKDVEELSFCEV